MIQILFIIGAVLMTLPGVFLRVTGAHPDPLQAALLFGMAVVGAAFLLSWAAEVLQLDVSQGLALGLLALIAVLPEYIVDATFAWRAAHEPAFAEYAVANMTGFLARALHSGQPLFASDDTPGLILL